MRNKILSILAVIGLTAVSSFGVNEWDIRSAQYADDALHGATNFGVYYISASSYYLTTNIVISGVVTDSYTHAVGTGVYEQTTAKVNSNYVFQLSNRWFIQLDGAIYTNATWKLMNYASPTTNFYGSTTNSPGVFLTNSVWAGSGAMAGACTVTVSTVTHYIPVAALGRTITYTNVDNSGATNVEKFINGILVVP